MIVTHGSFTVALIEDVPAAVGAAPTRVEGESPAVRALSGGFRRIALEVRRAVGGLPQHALLGGSFAPATGATARVTVHLDGKTKAADGRALASPLGRDLIPGLADEFGPWVMERLVGSELPAGQLVVDRAAYDPVESSPLAFDAAAELLGRLLCLEHEPTDTDVRTAIDHVRERG